MDEDTVNRVYDQERDFLDVGEEKIHPFYHVCRKCINACKVFAIASIVELILFWPTHKLFHELGWL